MVKLTHTCEIEPTNHLSPLGMEYHLGYSPVEAHCPIPSQDISCWYPGLKRLTPGYSLGPLFYVTKLLIAKTAKLEHKLANGILNSYTRLQTRGNIPQQSSPHLSNTC